MSQISLPIKNFPPVPMPNTHGLVVLSGGQDSVTCMGLSLKCYERVSAIGFDYGQTHEVELTVAADAAAELGVPFEIIKVSSLEQLADSALITGGDMNAKHERNAEVPASFVPNRNAIFMTLAHAYAQKIGAKFVVTGVSQSDYSGYPDCRKVFIKKLESTLNMGYNTNVKFITPLSYLTKAQTFALAEEVGVLDIVINSSHTCYNGDRTIYHDWGYGCDNCPSCELRKNGYLEFIENKL